jgi:PKD repeat protein
VQRCRLGRSHIPHADNASTGPGRRDTSLSCNFNGSATTNGSTISSYGWTFGDSNSGSGANISHTYGIGGYYNVTLTVTDSGGVAASKSKQVRVDGPPSADFTFYCAAQGCDFDASTSTDDFGIQNYSWNFGDGTTGSGALSQHNYFLAGTYTVRLTLTDTAGQTSSTSKSVSVSYPGDNPPTGPITAIDGE